MSQVVSASLEAAIIRPLTEQLEQGCKWRDPRRRWAKADAPVPYGDDSSCPGLLPAFHPPMRIPTLSQISCTGLLDGDTATWRHNCETYSSKQGMKPALFNTQRIAFDKHKTQKTPSPKNVFIILEKERQVGILNKKTKMGFILSRENIFSSILSSPSANFSHFIWLYELLLHHH